MTSLRYDTKSAVLARTAGFSYTAFGPQYIIFQEKTDIRPDIRILCLYLPSEHSGVYSESYLETAASEDDRHQKRRHYRLPCFARPTSRDRHGGVMIFDNDANTLHTTFFNSPHYRAQSLFMTFQQLNISRPTLRALEEKNYVSPTPIQQQAIPEAMNGRGEGARRRRSPSPSSSVCAPARPSGAPSRASAPSYSRPRASWPYRSRRSSPSTANTPICATR